MKLIPIRQGLKICGKGASSLLPKASVFDVRVACISGKAMKTEAELALPKPKPWPYQEKGYNNFWGWIDGTTKRLNENSKVIFVEGPVATGKTAFAKALAEDLEMKYFPMVNMDSWYVNSYGYDLRQLDDKLPQKLKSYDFSNFAKNPKDPRATCMQFRLLNSKYSQYVDALAHLLNTGQGVVLDRSWYSDMVFVEAMHQCEYMKKDARDYYFRVRDNIWQWTMRPHLVIYLDSPVSVITSNLQKRGKGEEKALTPKFLEVMEDVYKHQYLKSISDHAELLIYDWSTPGEPEVVVDDIERIDFDNYELHSPKMEDWRLDKEYDWAEKRHMYTDKKSYVMADFLLPEFDIPELIQTGEEGEILNRVYGTAPGEEYDEGYNADMGDTGILFKTKITRDVLKMPEPAAAK